eukprot:scaffold79463_cov26-Tisochrysis_lutea.AAC.2
MQMHAWSNRHSRCDVFWGRIGPNRWAVVLAISTAIADRSLHFDQPPHSPGKSAQMCPYVRRLIVPGQQTR